MKGPARQARETHLDQHSEGCYTITQRWTARNLVVLTSPLSKTVKH